MGEPLRQRLGRLAVAENATAALREGRSYAVGGLVGSSSALLIAALQGATEAPWLVVAPGPDEAELLAEDIVQFLGDESAVVLFPAFDSARPENRARETGKIADRVAVVEALVSSRSGDAKGAPRLIVAPLAAVLQPVPPAEALRGGRVELEVGQELDLAAFAKRLVEGGMFRVPLAEAAGEFAVRGGIVDVYPRSRELPIRIELLGDEIDEIRRFDPESQRSIEALEHVVVPLVPAAVAAGAHAVRGGEDRARDLKRATLLTDVLPPGAIIAHHEETAAAKWLARFEKSRPEEDLGTLYARFSLGVLEFANLRLSGAPIAREAAASNARVISAAGLARDLISFQGAIQALIDANDEVLLCCGGDGEATRMTHLLSEAGFDPTSDDGRALSIVTDRVTHGFQLPELGTAIVSADELFGRTRLPRARASQAKRQATTPEWTDLRKGDPVVHLEHGIGIYRGLEKLERDGSLSEHLKVEFHGSVLVYVPVTKASLVHRYVGATEATPRLSKIGSKAWEKQKFAVAHSVEGVAAELLRVQALRAARPGVSFPPDSAEQLEFEATFPFDLTSDQEAALAAIKADMERDTPTDRLLCGDVGFGKTELAVRAAFKAVMAGRQVAVLVPTTVLAEQHGATFAERFAGYPILVDVLSRFRTKGEQREILKKAAEGKTDVVIGTHRLVSADVEFQDLGMLVIDEEQRFGVRAKETLRAARATVDVLTLTATPIPRTLHMALLGLRDISSLAIAPHGRRPIHTEVISPDDATIRGYLLRELERGGQAYYIHNRVQSIDAVAAKLRHAVPEARVSVIHGQMSPRLVEQRMLDFTDHKSDILVATTIVESGLDIPNANTMFIDRAELLGLADLHQLRGRVGRYHRRAYCYLMVRPGTLPTDAERRVRAVEEHSDLGAGFRIAMRDLEIRGAGNLLGHEQSGHIAAVGYELYCQLLADAVKRARKDRVPFRTACHVGLRVQTAVPREYVSDDRSRIQLYRRLSCAASVEEVAGVLAESRDRFGPPPEEVHTVAKLARVRICGELLGVTRMGQIVHDGRERVLLRCVEPNRVKNSLKHLGTRLRVVDRGHCHLLLPRGKLTEIEVLDAVLLALSGGGGAS